MIWRLVMFYDWWWWFARHYNVNGITWHKACESFRRSGSTCLCCTNRRSASDPWTIYLREISTSDRPNTSWINQSIFRVSVFSPQKRNTYETQSRSKALLSRPGTGSTSIHARRAWSQPVSKFTIVFDHFVRWRILLYREGSCPAASYSQLARRKICCHRLSWLQNCHFLDPNMIPNLRTFYLIIINYSIMLFIIILFFNFQFWLH